MQLQELSADKITDYSLWKTTARLKRPTIHNPPIRKQDNSWAKSDIEKANAFAYLLQKTFQPYKEIKVFNYPHTVQESIEIQPFTTSEIIKEIKNIKPGKSPGFDLITGDILKNLPNKALEKMNSIMNACLYLKYVPLHWKVSEVIMIQKPGKDVNLLTSYRPISLLPVMGKIFEKLFSIRLKQIITYKNLIPSHQFGFREKHSTIDQVHRIAHTIEEALEQKKSMLSHFLRCGSGIR